ncbi:hypothetical protein LPJ61_002300 [Coemansia biformis]|uniref:GATA-type domain-containing protein n=1 Tax=Coemansia biformis TaxID=1286918 RepID=A0A9W8CZA9_9FUNG|nr:hypothetical protein LPJ61_002300 [Coemansia biformis]
MASSDPVPPGDDKQSGPARRKPIKRAYRSFVEEPLYLLPTHYTLLQDSTYELMRGLAGLSTAADDDPLYFDQLLAAAVNVKHAFDLGRIDVINGTIRPRNTSLCHECITTVSSVWRSGPEGPRTLCNACGLRFYKQNQRRAIEARRREACEPDGAAPAPQGTTTDTSPPSGSRTDAAAAMDDDDDDDAHLGDRQPQLSPEPTRPSIANLCGPSSSQRVPFFPSISNILVSPSQTPEPPIGRHKDDDDDDDGYGE